MARRNDRFVLFERDLQMAIGEFTGPALNAELARYARASLKEVIDNGEASSSYDKYVNGRFGAEEETVKAPGPIVYYFIYWQPIIEFALEFLRKRSPVKTGRYQDSHVVMIGSQVITDYSSIASDEIVTIVNTQPYSRKIEVGHMQMSAERGVYKDAQKAIMGRFGGAAGAIGSRVTSVLLPGGYILKGRFRRGFRKYARTGLKADTQAGQPMRYPAIEMWS